MTARVWGDAARALFDLSGPTAVSAGAGSGKTTCLVELVTRLLSGEATGTPCDPGEIVAITFTEKAATELEERLRAAVAARAAEPGASPEDARAWRLRVHALERMTIGTIHGFARRLLREHALEAGVDPEFEVLDEEVASAWRSQAARAAVLSALDAGRAEARQLVAAHGAGPLSALVADLVRERGTRGDSAPLEPAPDGVEEALAARARAVAAAEALVEAGASAGTSTGRRAVERLREAVAALEGADRGGSLAPGDPDRLAALAAAVRGWRVGRSDGERARDMKRAVEELVAEALPSVAEALAGAQKRELCHLVGAAEERLRARKREARVLDFDDLLVAARDLLRVEGGPRAALRVRIRALLVDEYQDVNPVQQAIFDLLAGDRGGAGGPILVAVGDRKQSIYAFRGADVTVFQDLLRRFRAAPGARVLDLATNHRSSAPVLELVNTVFARCMQPPTGDARPYELAFEDADRLVPARSGGAAPACEILEDGAEGSAAERRVREAAAIAARIRALVSGAAGVGVPDPSPDAPGRVRRPRPGDVAVLFRRLTQLAEYEGALREAGLPYRIARGGGFYQAPEVRDLGELLAALVEPGDAIAWAALLRSPLCAASEGALLVIAREGLDRLPRQDPGAVAAALRAADPGIGEDADRVRLFLETWRELRALRDRVPLEALLARAVERLDLEAVHLASPDGERRVANVRKAIALARRFGERGGTAAAFAERLRRMARERPREPEAELEPGDAVALLSVHQAKGLEWPIVFVPDMGASPRRDARRAAIDAAGALAASFHDPERDVHHVTRSLSAARAEAARAASAESRRLLYVATTRARDRLVLSGEAGRGGESWRALVEDAIAGRPELALRIPLAQAGTFACGPPVVAGSPPPERPAAPDADRPAPPAPIAGPPPLLAIRVAVTELAEHQRCPRRLAFREMGVPEHGGGGGARQDDPDRATARGTLAHAMIAETDLVAPPLERHAQLAAAAARRGYDPRSTGVRRILGDVTRFLASPAGVALAAAARRGALRREVPFLLRTDGAGAPACYLSGAIDALVDGEDGVEVIDFKYALPSGSAVERYRFQLLAYALAVGRARPGRRVTTRLQFLRGGCRAMDLTPSDRELREFARALPRAAASLHDGSGRALAPAALGRTRERCLAERCGFVARCHP